MGQGNPDWMSPNPASKLGDKAKVNGGDAASHLAGNFSGLVTTGLSAYILYNKIKDIYNKLTNKSSNTPDGENGQQSGGPGDNKGDQGLPKGPDKGPGPSNPSNGPVNVGDLGDLKTDPNTVRSTTTKGGKGPSSPGVSNQKPVYRITNAPAPQARGPISPKPQGQQPVSKAITSRPHGQAPAAGRASFPSPASRIVDPRKSLGPRVAKTGARGAGKAAGKAAQAAGKAATQVASRAANLAAKSTPVTGVASAAVDAAKVLQKGMNRQMTSGSGGH